MKPSEKEPRLLAAYTKGYAVGFSGGASEDNPWKGKYGDPNRGFENAWYDGWNDGWYAGKVARKAQAELP